LKEENSIFALDSELNNLWIVCLSKASHKEAKWDYIVKGKGKIYVNLQPGQFVCGRHSLAKILKTHPSTAWKRLKTLEKNKFISIKSDKKYSIITIINWDSYNDLQNLKKQEPIQEPIQERIQERIQLRDTKNNDNNVKNGKNVKKSMAKKKFIPPTLEEVREFISINTLKVCPDTFFKYFEAGDWIDSKGNPVRSWKQKILTWASRTNTITNRIPTNKKIYTAEESRVISPEEERRMEIEFLRHINQ